MIDVAKLRRLQTRVGVTADGVFGRDTLNATLAALGEAPAGQSARERTMHLQRRVGASVDGIFGNGTLDAALAALSAGAPSPTSRGTAAQLSDPTAFFAVIRSRLSRLNPSQVQGFEFLLARMGAAGWAIAWVAYGLATAWHETAARMQPVREGLDASDAWRRRNLRYYPWYGRGYPQTTWEENYRKADEKLGLGGTLVANPDRMLEPDIAADTMIRGMVEGWFAGDNVGRHTLERHLPARGRSTDEQRRAARRIINGTDKAAKIAGEALVIEDALAAGGWA